MTYRVRNIVVAVGLALVAALLTTFYVANYKRHVQQGEETVQVFVAAKDVEAGRTGDHLVAAHLLTRQDVARRNVVPGAISAPDQVERLVAVQPIYAGEQVTLRRFANHAEQGVRVQLHGTLRALSVPGTPDQLLSGTLKDGDHVDVIANIKTGGCPICFADRVVARNLLVLRAPVSSTSSKVSNPSGGFSALLAVSDRKEAQKIWYAVQNSAGWSLMLRPIANAVDSKEDVEGLGSVLKDGAATDVSSNYAVGGDN